MELDARQLDVVVARDLRWIGAGRLDAPVDEDVRVAARQLAELVVGWRGVKTDDETVADEPKRVVVAIERLDLGEGIVDVVGDPEQAVVAGRDESELGHLVA